ncbi:class I SAM-dependent methyltransferase [Streptomyces varsoviensis]|uniref:class I SAM-dependent methyltransferase n=1 Tax=Streptomyces varsoviensis TaxID=67373 RepID=UPI0033D8FCB6
MSPMNRGFPPISVPRSPSPCPSSDRTMEGVFTELYDNDTWNLYLAGEEERGSGGDKDTSRSGNGSNLAQTATLRAELPRLLARLGVRTLLDIPCGDFYWMSRLDLGLDAYTGADLVPEIVERNARDFARPGREFRVLDITRSPLPKVDMVFSRDCLVHFGDSAVRAALENVKRSGSTYFAATTFTDRTDNAADIETGGWRSLNLTLPPFSLPAPNHVINENCSEVYVAQEGDTGVRYDFTDKSVGVWRVADL